MSMQDYERLHGCGRSDREKLRDAFRRLREKGIVAKMKFSCCTSCGSYEISLNHGPDVPYVFWHRQNESSFDPVGDIREEGLCLYWRANDQELEDILSTLEEEGLTVKAPKNSMTAIAVY